MSLDIEGKEQLRDAHDKIDKVEDRLQEMEVTSAERHATTISKLDQLADMLSTLSSNQADHAQETNALQLDMATSKLRLTNAELDIKTFKSRFWALLIAAIGFVGAMTKSWWK